jgi:nitrite reductase (NO-forming)
VEFATDVPGEFLLVDHALFRAFNKGALGVFTVSGDEDPAVYAGLITEGIYEPEGGAIQSFAAEAPEPVAATSVEERIALGREVYARNCVACHQAAGQGIGDVFPPLAASDYLNEDPQRAIRAIIAGLSGPITVNGVEYRSQMPAIALSDEDAANVLTYVYSQWGNSGQVIEPEDVRAVR